MLSADGCASPTGGCSRGPVGLLASATERAPAARTIEVVYRFRGEPSRVMVPVRRISSIL